jgi:hypothetical protein
MSAVYPPPPPGPGPSMMDYVKGFLGGGLTGAAQTGGMQMPGWSNAIGSFLQKPEVNMALGATTPIKGAQFPSAYVGAGRLQGGRPVRDSPDSQAIEALQNDRSRNYHISRGNEVPERLKDVLTRSDLSKKAREIYDQMMSMSK